MAESDNPGIDHERRVAFHTGRLGAARQRTGGCRLQHDRDATHRAHRAAEAEWIVRDRYAPVLDEPIPRRLLVHAQRRTASGWARGMATIMVVATAAGGGWWVGAQREPGTPSAAFGQLVVQATREQSSTMRRVASANMPATTASPGEPDLSSHGFFLTRRHQLAQNGHPMSEFVYQDDGGRTVRVYAQNMQPGVGASPRVFSHDGLSLARWETGGFNYALVGSLPTSDLQSLAVEAARADSDATHGETTGQPKSIRPHAPETAGTATVNDAPPASVVPAGASAPGAGTM
ncbi:hypothetical protein [Salinisphaera sp. T31B1]|uniref:hypothetical protein n=1 Tax=Salinisphaera sp. T31B1 TaxID=727963 RepID=UPI003341701B